MLYATHARIHLDHIRNNILAIRQAVGQRKVLIAVKANAYGHGAVEVSRMAQQVGVDWLGVATVPEALQLREAGIGLPILKFSPSFREEMEPAVSQGVTLSLCSQANAHGLEAAALACGKPAKAHLKLDTGMGRVGVALEEAPGLAAWIAQQCPHIELDGVFTHLPVSDEADTHYTALQIQRFKAGVIAIEGALGRKIALAHCANSGAVLGHPDAWLDMVRPGVMIYGFYPDAGTPRTLPLAPGMSLYTRVSFLKRIPAGTSVGYGRTWVAPEDTWIATIPAGYADGFNRLFSNRGRVLIQDSSYPLVGRVCMDQSMVNLGPHTKVQVGDEVVLLGRSGDQVIDGDEWAKQLGTITYEVTCQISPRVTRVFEGR